MTTPIPHPPRRVRPDRPFVGRGLRDAWAHFSTELLAGVQARYPHATWAGNQVLLLIDADGATVAELARRAGMTKQSMAESVANLEQWGLLERVAHPSDRRARLVRLTADGWDAVRAGLDVAVTIEQRWSPLLGARDMRQLALLLERLVQRLDTDDGHLDPHTDQAR